MSNERLANPIGQGARPMKENIGWFEVPMDDAGLMGIINSQTDRCKQLQDICARRNFPYARCAVYILCQRLSFDPIHNQAGHSGAWRLWVQETEVVDPHDVGMMQ